MDLFSEDSDEAARACRHAGMWIPIHILSTPLSHAPANQRKKRFLRMLSHCIGGMFPPTYALYRSIIGSASGRAQVLASFTVRSSRAASWMACMMSSTW